MSDILKYPEHRNPGHNRTATAPYNFVPLPETVVKAVKRADDLPDHDRYDTERHSGYFEVTLKTLSPLYVRGMLSARRAEGAERSEFEQSEAEKSGKRTPRDYMEAIKNKPAFFFTRDPNRPVIPGSSLRGMLRGLVEMISYGKMQWVTDKKLFFRTVDDTAVGVHYRNRMMNKVETGFLRRAGNRYYIKVCRMARVKREQLDDVTGANLYRGSPPNQHPIWDAKHTPHQYQLCSVKVAENGWSVERFEWGRVEGLAPARLVITGNMPSYDPDKAKKAEFVFLLPEDNADEVTVSSEKIAQFHDDDQITRWQREAFPANQPLQRSRERDGMLCAQPSDPGEPVFFLRENDQLTFVGRARMFRLPYKNRPIDLVPPDLRRAEDIDFAEALFGYVKPKKKSADDLTGVDGEQGDKARAYAGRVFVTDATLANEYAPADLWLLGNAQADLTPRILSTPKPTAFQHYVVQPSHEVTPERAKKALSHYDSPTRVPATESEPEIRSEASVIRGHKLYWRQGDRTADQIKESDPYWVGEDGKFKRKSTQHTRISPVKSGVEFTFRVHFENVSDEELGALCWALHPPGQDDVTYCHSLGMGKPLGLGAVKLEVRLHQVKRDSRYRSLLAGETWKTGEDNPPEELSVRATQDRLTESFERRVIETLGLYPKHKRLRELKRIGMLLKLMEWPQPGQPHADTRYMPVKAFKDRPTLPDPSAFGALAGTAEPNGAKRWPDIPFPKVIEEPPKPKKAEGAAAKATPPARPTPDPNPEPRDEVKPEALSTMDAIRKAAEEREKQAGRRRRL